MDSSVKNLEDKMNEGITVKKDYENFEEKMRRNFEIESAKMEEEERGKCKTVSST